MAGVIPLGTPNIKSPAMQGFFISVSLRGSKAVEDGFARNAGKHFCTKPASEQVRHRKC
jgi:hypothetical protein